MTTHRRSSTSRPTSPGLAAAFAALDEAPLDTPLTHKAQEDIIRQAHMTARGSQPLDPCAHVRVTVRVGGPTYV